MVCRASGLTVCSKWRKRKKRTDCDTAQKVMRKIWRSEWPIYEKNNEVVRYEDVSADAILAACNRKMSYQGIYVQGLAIPTFRKQFVGYEFEVGADVSVWRSRLNANESVARKNSG